jgi:hypothetical protein
VSDELIARLRALSASDADIYDFEEWGPSLMREAADRIEELEAQDHFCPTCDLACKDCLCVERRIERMEAVVDGVKAVLGACMSEGMLEMSPGPVSMYHLPAAAIDVLRIAWLDYRGALAALDAQINHPTRADKVRCPNCEDKDANIADLIETLQRTEAAKETHCAVCAPRIYDDEATDQHVRGLNAEGEKK